MYEDRPFWRLYETVSEKYFHNHPMGFRVLGTQDTIRELTVDQMRGYFSQRYSPDNMIVAAAGKVDFDLLVDDVARLAGDWKPTGAKRTHDQPRIQPQQFTMEDARVNRHYMAMIWPAPCAQDDRRYAAKVLTDVLGDSDGSKLYWALIDPGYADEADVSFAPQDQLGYEFAYASCDPKRAEQVEKLLTDTIRDAADSLDDAEIERAKNKIATSATLQGERPMGRMMALGGTWCYLNQYLPLQEELAKIMAVTTADCRQLLRDCPFDQATIARLTPAKG